LLTKLFGMGWLPISLIIAGTVLALLLWLRPALPVRWALTLFVRLFYRMRVIGQENIPAEGPALLVCNHVSYIDWILLLVAQRRVIRFVVFAGWTQTFFIRHLLRWGKVIPIDASSGPRAIVKSLQAAGEALGCGDLVCIFAEGRFTRTGFLLPFRRGFEEIAKRGGAPIIPVCLDELWGSIFSFYGDRCLWKWPRQLPYSVTVAFGKPMPADTSAEQVRLAVQQLAADAAIARSDDLLPVHRQFVRAATRNRFRAAIVDGVSDDKEIERSGEVVKALRTTHGYIFTYFQVLARSIRLTWELRAKLGDEPVIGIWMPTSADAAIANLVAAFCRKAVVNLNTQWSAEELAAVIGKCKIRQVLVSQKFAKHYRLPPLPALQPIDVELLTRIGSRWRALLAWTAAFVLPRFFLDRYVLRLCQHRLDDLATILITTPSGEVSSNRILHTHRGLASAVSSLAKTYDLSSRCLVLGEFGFDHSVGYTFSLWAPLSIGVNAGYSHSETPAGSPG
jgi:acyl-[acyl-carrier-protein]-phospholipid O-acyltransferase / long-chain-fatty-acid--[acyl-carrier-protein] ligase